MNVLKGIKWVVNGITWLLLLMMLIAFGILYVSDHSLELIHNEDVAAVQVEDTTGG